MATRYAIGSDELLIITVKWIGGINSGTTNTLETDVRCYSAGEVQQIIDDNVSDTCTVIGVDRYDHTRRIGEDISEDFDIRSQADRDDFSDRNGRISARRYAGSFHRAQYELVKGADL